MRFVRLAALVVSAIALAACQVPTRPPQPAPTPTPVQPEPAPAVIPEPQPAAPSQPTQPDEPAEPLEVKLRGKEVFSRLVARFADPPCVKDRVVQRWELTYARWPTRLSENLKQILPLMALVVDELETHHLPGEFALLPIVESWYRPDAGSPRLAYGMWQFTTPTARNQGLRIQSGFDERLAPQAATRAAMRYLASLQNRFGDWKLSNMAFNAGEYRILRALAKQPRAETLPSASAHSPPGLSMTTYEHLAKVQALACLIAHPRRFGLKLPTASRIQPLQLVSLPVGVESLESAATRARMDPGALKALNPAFLRGRIVAGAPREVLLPREAARHLADTATAQQDRGTRPVGVSPQTTASKPREYQVRSGDTLSGIAQRLGVRLGELLRWNGIDVRALLQPGQILRLEP